MKSKFILKSFLGLCFILLIGLGGFLLFRQKFSPITQIAEQGKNINSAGEKQSTNKNNSTNDSLSQSPQVLAESVQKNDLSDLTIEEELANIKQDFRTSLSNLTKSITKKLALSGGTIRGDLIIRGNLDVYENSDLKDTLDMNSHRITNLKDPSRKNDAANKDYVDKQIALFSSNLAETDPLFIASPALGITNSDISNWNTAYAIGTGSFTETDPTAMAYLNQSVKNSASPTFAGLNLNGTLARGTNAITGTGDLGTSGAGGYISNSYITKQYFNSGAWADGGVATGFTQFTGAIGFDSGWRNSDSPQNADASIAVLKTQLNVFHGDHGQDTYDPQIRLGWNLPPTGMGESYDATKPYNAWNMENTYDVNQYLPGNVWQTNTEIYYSTGTKPVNGISYGLRPVWSTWDTVYPERYMRHGYVISQDNGYFDVRSYGIFNNVHTDVPVLRVTPTGTIWGNRTNPYATVDIQGANSDVKKMALYVTNSNNDALLAVNNDGRVIVHGDATRLHNDIDNPDSLLTINIADNQYGANNKPAFGINYNQWNYLQMGVANINTGLVTIDEQQDNASGGMLFRTGSAFTNRLSILNNATMSLNSDTLNINDNVGTTNRLAITSSGVGVGNVLTMSGTTAATSYIYRSANVDGNILLSANTGDYAMGIGTRGVLGSSNMSYLDFGATDDTGVLVSGMTLSQNGTLGIGTTNVPYYDTERLKLVTTAAANAPSMIAEMYSDTANVGVIITQRRARGTEASPAAVQLGDLLGSNRMGGYNGASWSGAAVQINSYAAQTWTDNTHTGSELGFFTTPNNSGTALQRMRITNGGYVGIGTTAPTNLLDVAGGIKIGATYAGMATTAPANGMLVQGNVGIGTTNPLAMFSVGASSQFQVTSVGDLNSSGHLNLRNGGSSGIFSVGNVQTIQGSKNVNGDATNFITDLRVGDQITVGGETQTIASIVSDTLLTTINAWSNNHNSYSEIISNILSVGNNSQFQVSVDGGVTAQGYLLGNLSSVPSIVFAGDSLTTGYGGSHPYPYYITMPTYNGIAFNQYNTAWGGQFLSEIYRFSPTEINKYYANNAGINILVVLAGTNDIIWGNSPEQTFGVLQQFCQHQRSLGWKVIVATVPSVFWSGASYDSQKDTYNNLIRTNWTQFADGLADIAANPNLGADGAYNNTTYFNADKIHLTDTGYALVGGIAQTAITTMINNANNFILPNGTLGTSSSYISSSYITKNYFNATANIDGSVAGSLTMNGIIARGTNAITGTGNIGATNGYVGTSYITRNYFNSTAYLDGATAGSINSTGNFDVTGNIGIGTTAPGAKIGVDAGMSGNNLIVNGTFETDSNWTISPSGSWGIGFGYIIHLGGGVTGTFSQNVSTIVAGQAYRLMYTVNKTTGSFSVTPSAGGWTGTTRSTTGTFTEYFTATNNNALSFSGSDNGANWSGIDDIVLEPIAASFLGGSVGIGTNNPIGKLHVSVASASAPNTQYAAYIENLATNITTDGINKYGLYIKSTGDFTGAVGTANNNYGLYLATTSGGDNNYQIMDQSGANLDTTGHWNTASDRNKKKDITNLNYGLSDLMKLRPVNFSWKANGTPDIGFIAQEVKDVIPEIVYGEDGNMSISYGNLTALLTKAVQEQQGEITAQNTTNVDQENKLAGLDLKTSINITTLAELQGNIDEQLNKVSTEIGKQNSLISDIQNQLSTQASLMDTLQAQLEELKKLNNQALNLAQIGLNTTEIDNLKLTLGIEYIQDKEGKIIGVNVGDGLINKLQGEILEGEKLVISVKKDEDPKIGTVYLCPKDFIFNEKYTKDSEICVADPDGDGKSVEVKMKKEIDGQAKIFATPESPVAIGVSKADDNKSFTLKVAEAVSEMTRIDWWIVDVVEENPVN